MTDDNNRQDCEIKEIRRQMSRFVTYTVFFWIVGSLITVILVVMAFEYNKAEAIDSKVDANTLNYTKINEQLQSIKDNQKEQKDTLKNISDKLQTLK